jgi:hypothetical protein
MQMTITTALLFLGSLLLSTFTDEPDRKPQQATVSLWNLQYLFDFEDDPDNPGDDEI